MSGHDGFPDSFVHDLPDPHAPNTLVPTTFTRFITAEEIAARNQILAEAIVNDYLQSGSDRPPVFMVVLRGAMRWAVELSEQVARLSPGLEPEIDTIVYSSYGRNTTSGELHLQKGPSLNIDGRDVVLVEDIIDRGNTVRAAVNYLRALGPASVAVAALLQRETGVRRLVSSPPHPRATTHVPNPRPTPTLPPIPINYAGFDIESGFVAGHGLDVGRNGGYRAWPDIYAPVGPRAYAPSRILGLNSTLVTDADGAPITSWILGTGSAAH